MLYYAKPDYFDSEPEIFNPTSQQLQVAGQKAFQFIGSDKRTLDEIEKYLLVTLGYGAIGATGEHVKRLLDQMVVEGYLKVSDGLFLEQEEGGEP